MRSPYKHCAVSTLTLLATLFGVVSAVDADEWIPYCGTVPPPPRGPIPWGTGNDPIPSPWSEAIQGPVQSVGPADFFGASLETLGRVLGPPGGPPARVAVAPSTEMILDHANYYDPNGHTTPMDVLRLAGTSAPGGSDFTIVGLKHRYAQPTDLAHTMIGMDVSQPPGRGAPWHGFFELIDWGDNILQLIDRPPVENDGVAREVSVRPLLGGTPGWTLAVGPGFDIGHVQTVIWGLAEPTVAGVGPSGTLIAVGSVVPEPATIGILLVGGVGLLRRMRR